MILEEQYPLLPMANFTMLCLLDIMQPKNKQTSNYLTRLLSHPMILMPAKNSKDAP